MCQGSNGVCCLLLPDALLQGCTTKHDGKKMVIFTKQEYRQLDGMITSTGRSRAVAVSDGSMMVDEGEEEDPNQQQTKSAKRRQKQQTRRSSSFSKGGQIGNRKAGNSKSGRSTFKDMQQRTLMDYMAKSGSVL